MTINRITDVAVGAITIGATVRMMNYAYDVMPKRKKGKKKRRGY